MSKADANSVNTHEPTPFERFQELARRLFAVPKEELDKKKAEYKAARRQKPFRKS